MTDKGLKPFDELNANCTYTNAGGEDVKFSLDALFEVVASIPKEPKIFTMDIKAFMNGMLGDNTIILSKDVADALEQAMRVKGKG